MFLNVKKHPVFLHSVLSSQKDQMYFFNSVSSGEIIWHDKEDMHQGKSEVQIATL